MAAAGLTLALVGAPLAAATASGSDSDSLEGAYSSAASKYDVPRDLLVAMGWSETRLDGHAGKPSQANGYGLMHLVSHPGQHTLEKAASLTDRDVSELKRNDAANIDGAAAVLDDLAERKGLDEAQRDDLSRWLPLLADYSGTEGAATRSYVESVADTLEKGVKATVSQERITTAPHDVDPGAALDKLPQPKAAAEGDQPGVRWVPASTSNYKSGRSASIDQVVVHVTQGSYAGSISWFQNPDAEVSAHYVIRSSDGEITQMVREADTAWHAGNSNARAVGIEHEGYVDDPEWFTESMYKSSAELVKGIASRHNIPLDRDHIIGHSEAPGATHTDPGPHWDWDHYMELVGGSSAPSDGLTFSSYPTQKQGASGAHVKALQTLLKAAGSDPGTIDGTFGAGTLKAVKAFQTKVSLEADGVVGAKTWTAALAAGDTPKLKSGATGDAVKRLQRALTAATGKTVTVDGTFGSATLAAVKSFQTSHQLDADGVVGPATWKVLQAGG